MFCLLCFPLFLLGGKERRHEPAGQKGQGRRQWWIRVWQSFGSWNTWSLSFQKSSCCKTHKNLGWNITKFFFNLKLRPQEKGNRWVQEQSSRNSRAVEGTGAVGTEAPRRAEATCNDAQLQWRGGQRGREWEGDLDTRPVWWMKEEEQEQPPARRHKQQNTGTPLSRPELGVGTDVPFGKV